MDLSLDLFPWPQPLSCDSSEDCAHCPLSFPGSQDPPQLFNGKCFGVKQSYPVEQETKCSCLEAATVETHWCK